MLKIIEMACIENTNRIACQTVNTPLHREERTQSLKLRTMTGLCDRHGKEAEEYQERLLESVLESYGWNSETEKGRRSWKGCCRLQKKADGRRTVGLRV